jgi:hypothetical protein
VHVFSTWCWLLAPELLLKADAASRLAMAEKRVMLMSSGWLGTVPDGQIIGVEHSAQK